MKKILLIIMLSSLCLADISTIPSFNSGVLSPKVRARIDVDKYYSGLQTLENMHPKPQGPITKRPGTYYIQDTNEARLIPFEYSVTQSYVLEFSDETIRFYKD